MFTLQFACSTLLTLGTSLVMEARRAFQLVVIASAVFYESLGLVSEIQKPQWSNSWSVEIAGGEEKANEIARKHGLVNMGKIGSLKDKYTFVKLDSVLAPFSVEHDSHNFFSDPEVKYVSHQQKQRRVKKFSPPTSSDDPLWEYQWSLNRTNEQYLDINVVGAWIQGYTGRGISVGVVDDGVDGNHKDLRDNYNSGISYDYFDFDSNADPSSDVDYHGTACTGEIAMVRSNDQCGVGAAYNSIIAGIRLLGGGSIVDSQEASSLSHERQNIQVYSNSWGPSDDSITVAGPGDLVQQAFFEGISEGRGGKGSLFTWAAGNGGDIYDTCAADGYVQSIHTIAVGGYAQSGGPAYFDEKCSAKMTVAYVENTINPEIHVPTTITNDQCTLDFTGTSAAAPLVSAILALALEANSELTWRDIQYLIVYTSNTNALLDNTDDHFVNGAGLLVSHQFGFGAINGEAMVTRARRWINVPEQINDAIMLSVDSGQTSFGNPFVSSFKYLDNIRYLEHIVLKISLHVAPDFTEAIDPVQASEIISTVLDPTFFEGYTKRGDFKVTLTSPSNTTSTLLFERPFDIVNTEGYYEWPFLTVLHWGEDPTGEWAITVTWSNSIGKGIVSNASVALYGVSNLPDSVANTANCNTLCAGRCGGPLSSDCDSCNSQTVRNATSLECINPTDCIEPYVMSDGYCYVPSSASSLEGMMLHAIFLSLMVYFLF